MTPPLRVLGLAAAFGRVGTVYLSGGEPKHWQVSQAAAQSTNIAAKAAIDWITAYRPTVVVTERVDVQCRKRERMRAIITAMTEAATDSGVLTMSIPLSREHANKHEEATELATRYPTLAAWLPEKRKIYEPEPRNYVLFEALALADVVERQGTIGLAAAMG